jgi:iron complex outermembrane receptor protein
LKLRHRFSCTCILNAALWLSPAAFSQSSGDAGSIEGVVIDQSGAAVANASVSLRNPATGYRQSAKTTAEGSFRITGVPPSQYRIEASASGFSEYSQDVTVPNGLPVQVKAILPAVDSLHTAITVTATRTATELDNATVSTSLVTRGEIETRNLNQVDQALSLIEGVNAYRARGPGDNDFGIGLRGFAGRGGQSRTLVLVDGQPLNNSYIGNVNWAMLPVSEFERVEVARGPFSSLYGGNAMGGVINLITRPVDHRVFEIYGQYGQQNTVNYNVHFADRFFDKLGVSFGYDRYQTGGYQDQEVLSSATTSLSAATPVTGPIKWLTPTGGITYQIGLKGNDWFNSQAYRTRLEYAFSRKTIASMQYFHESRGQGYKAYNTFLHDSQGRPVDSGLVSFQDGGVTRLLSLSPSLFIGGPTGATGNIVQGQFLTAFNSQWNLRIAGGMTESPIDWYVTPGANATLSSGIGTYVPTFSRGVYGNVQLGWTHSRHQFIFGTDTRHDEAQIYSYAILNYALPGSANPITTSAGGQSINQSAYVQDQFSVTERFHVVLGGRYDYWRTYDGSNQLSATAPVTSYADRSANALTGKLSGSYQLPAGFQLRASVGNAFRNPTVYELYRNTVIGSSQYLANPAAQPERLLSYDAGVQRRFGTVGNIDVAYFDNHIHDLLYRTTDFVTDPTGHVLRLSNAGLGRTRGVEIAAKERVFPWLQLKQAWTYTNAILAENPSLPATVGKHIPYVPSEMLSFTALLNRNRWTGSVTGRYQDAVFTTDINSDTTRGVPTSYNPFFVADATVGYQVTKQVAVTANAFNLLDRQYWLYYRAPGRQVFVGLRIRL